MACPPSQPRTRQPWPPSGPLQAYGRVAKAGSPPAALLSMLHMCKGCRPLFPPPRGGRGSRGYAKTSPLPNAAQHGLEPWHAGSAAAVDMPRKPHAEWLPLVTPLATSTWLWVPQPLLGWNPLHHHPTPHVAGPYQCCLAIARASAWWLGNYSRYQEGHARRSTCQDAAST